MPEKTCTSKLGHESAKRKDHDSCQGRRRRGIRGKAGGEASTMVHFLAIALMHSTKPAKFLK